DRGEGVFQRGPGDVQVRRLELQPQVERAAERVRGVLVQGRDVGVVGIQKIGDGGDDAGPVRAGGPKAGDGRRLHGGSPVGRLKSKEAAAYAAASDHCLAEREGFEPSTPVKVYTISNRAPSAARPPLQKGAPGYPTTFSLARQDMGLNAIFFRSARKV